jgi:hypothetical protein
MKSRLRIAMMVLLLVVFSVSLAWACYTVGSTDNYREGTSTTIHCSNGKSPTIYCSKTSGRCANMYAEYSSFDEAAKAACGCR